MSIVVTRNEWGARRPKTAPTRISRVVGTGLHWEGPGMGWFEHDSCHARVRAIQNFHMDSRGWADIAYSALVCYHGYIFQGRWMGVRSAANGTNVGNANYYAICGLFGVGDPFTDEMKQAYWDCLNIFREDGGAGQTVVPHSFFKPTACPGPVRDWISAGLPLPHPPEPPPPPPEPPTPTNPNWLQEAIKLMDTIDMRPIWNGAIVTGQHVDNMQGLLLATMRDDCNPGAVDGQGGPKTFAALTAFQRVAGLATDGICGPQTWAKLIVW